MLRHHRTVESRQATNRTGKVPLSRTRSGQPEAGQSGSLQRRSTASERSEEQAGEATGDRPARRGTSQRNRITHPPTHISSGRGWKPGQQCAEMRGNLRPRRCQLEVPTVTCSLAPAVGTPGWHPVWALEVAPRTAKSGKPVDHNSRPLSLPLITSANDRGLFDPVNELERREECAGLFSMATNFQVSRWIDGCVKS